jgi:hypothetical protein
MTNLASYLPRLCRWPALAIGVSLAWALTWWCAGDVTTELGALWLMRFVAAVVVVAAAFALDDPSFDVTHSCVGVRRVLMPARFGVVCVAVVAGLVPAGVVVGDLLTGDTWRGLLLEVVSLAAVVCGVALLLQRRWRFFEPAQFVVFVVLLLGVYEQLTVGKWPLLAAPGAAWDDAHVRWLVVCGVGVALVATQLRDPASGPWRRVFSTSNAGVASRREHASP